MSDLAERINLSPSGLTRRLDGLVKLQWVERVRCTDDRRGMYAVLLPEGRAHVEKAAPDHVDQVRHFFIDLLSRRQLTDLAKALEPVVAGPGADSSLPGSLLPGSSPLGFSLSPDSTGVTGRVPRPW